MIRVLELNTANYDDHLGWIDRLQFIVDIILGKLNVQAASNSDGVTQETDTVPADIICLSEIRYSEANSFYMYAKTYWETKGITRTNPATDSMADMIVALLNHQSPAGTSWNIYTEIAMNYPGGPTQWEGLSIISRLPLYNQGFFKMPAQDYNERITQYATVNIDSSTPLTIYNTHFPTGTDDQSRKDRLTAAQYVSNAIVSNKSNNFVLAGDFNAGPEEDCINYLCAQYTDLWAKCKGTSELGYTYAAPKLVERIDYIFASKTLVSSSSQVEISVVPPSNGEDGSSRSGTVFASDHLGLWANIGSVPEYCTE